ncbi:hypothetical protein [Stieleria neptunia]|nr:hypothetical protein [Stieleria neptunia]
MARAVVVAGRANQMARRVITLANWNNESLLKLDGKSLSVLHADASLFAGRLGIDIDTDFGEIALDNIPVRDIFDFRDFRGYRVQIPNCEDYGYENPLLHPWFSTDSGYADIQRLDASLDLLDDRLLSVQIDLTTSECEDALPRSLCGTLIANCCPLDSTQLLHSLGPIPVRFAERYLPMLDLPGLPSDATQKHAIAAFGPPDHSGGGISSKQGTIPEWIRYALPNCYLRFQIVHDRITNFTIMRLSDPPCDLLKTESDISVV